jgi:hypothetical protein
MADDAYVVMLHVSGKGKESQWFDYRGGFNAPITRVEWELGSMYVALPQQDAAPLVRNGHARYMTDEEIAQYSDGSGTAS